MGKLGSSLRLKAPTSIELSDDIAHQIAVESVKALQFGPRGGMEVGGILLASSCGASTNIDDFKIIPCEHFYGSAYKLSSHDVERWRETVNKLAPGPVRVIGYWRSAIGTTGAPDSQDRAVLDDLLPEVPIFISVRPLLSGLCRGGLFLFESGPADWVAHPAFDFPTEAVTARQAAEQSKRTALDVISPVKKFSRRGQNLRPYLLAAAAMVVLMALTGAALQWRPPTLPNLGLAVAVQGNSLRISWDQAALRGAKQGVLLIREGSGERAIHLDEVQLATGFVVYAPASDDISMRFSIGGQNTQTIFTTARVVNNTSGK